MASGAITCAGQLVLVIVGNEIEFRIPGVGDVIFDRAGALQLHTQLGDALEQLGCVAVRITDESDEGDPQ